MTVEVVVDNVIMDENDTALKWTTSKSLDSCVPLTAHDCFMTMILQEETQVDPTGKIRCPRLLRLDGTLSRRYTIHIPNMLQFMTITSSPTCASCTHWRNPKLET